MTHHQWFHVSGRISGILVSLCVLIASVQCDMDVESPDGITESTESAAAPAPIVVNPEVVAPGGALPEPEVTEKSFTPQSTNIIYEGCIASKTCFSPFQDKYGLEVNRPDCLVAMTCEMVWAVGKQPINKKYSQLPDPDGRIVLEMFAHSTAWVAIGLSKDGRMGDDYVLECVKEQDGVINLYNSWNREGYSRNPDNIRLPGPGSVAELITSVSDPDSIYCMFYIHPTFIVTHPVNHIDHKYDLHQDSFCVLSAFGDRMKPNGEGIAGHSIGKVKGYASCREHINLDIRLTPTRKQTLILKIHGVFMTAAYLGFLCPSIFTVRYFKPTLSRLLIGIESWVWIHGVVPVVGLVFAICGWILAMVGKTGWRTPLTSPFHKYMGHTTFVVYIFEIVLGYYIRRTDVANLKAGSVYNVHIIAGHYACLGGIFVLMLTKHVESAYISCGTGLTYEIYVVLHFIIHIFMSFNRFWVEKLLGLERPKVSMLNPMVLLKQKAEDAEWSQEDPQASKLRKQLLVLYCVMVWIFSLAAILQIILSDYPCGKHEKDIRSVLFDGDVHDD